MLIDKVISSGLTQTGGRRVAEVRIGLKFCGVLLDDGSCGLSYVFGRDTWPADRMIEKAGFLAGKDAADLVQWAGDYKNLTRATVGVATLNALSQKRPISGATGANAIDLMEIRSEDVAGMIGYFAPLAEDIRKRARSTIVFERNLGVRDAYVYPDWAERALLPRCNVIIVSGTTMINKTADQILEWASGAREIAMIGPSTPLYPEVFAGSGLTLLGGSRVLPGAERAVLDVVAQGGGRRDLNQFLEKVNLRLSSPRHANGN